MARLYADEGFPIEIVRALRNLGHDVLTVQQADRRGHGDPSVLAFATSQGRTVLTRNRQDFVRIARSGVGHAGIVACTEDFDWVSQAARIDALLKITPDPAGKVLKVYKPSVPTAKGRTS